jgi:hypothetical protein
MLNEKNIINIIIVITVMTIIYYIFTSNNENFDSTISIDSIRDEVKNQYTIDVDSIRNLGAISKSLLTGTNYHSTTVGTPGTLTIPADNTVMNGNLIVGGVNIGDRIKSLQALIASTNTDLLAQINKNRMPDGTSVVFVGNLNDPCPNGWVKTSNFVSRFNNNQLYSAPDAWKYPDPYNRPPYTRQVYAYEIIPNQISTLNLCQPAP